MAERGLGPVLPLRGDARNSAFLSHGRARFGPRTTPRGEVGWWVGGCVGWLVGWRGGLNLRTAIPKGALVAEKERPESIANHANTVNGKPRKLQRVFGFYSREGV